MPKIAVRDIGATAAGEPEASAALTLGLARPVLAGAGDPIHLHAYALAPGGGITWMAAAHGRVAYVRQGTIEIAGVTVAAGGCVAIEHHATIGVTADEGAELLVFAAVGAASGRHGGNVHILPPAGVPRNEDFDGGHRVGGALLLDAGCVSCEMWLHETIVHPGGHETPPHAHSEDELIVVTEGEIILGRRSFGPGTVIAVARHTLYGFRSGSAGLRFLNFRPHAPFYLPRDSRRAPIDERRYHLDRMPPPMPRTIAARAPASN